MENYNYESLSLWSISRGGFQTVLDWIIAAFNGSLIIQPTT